MKIRYTFFTVFSPSFYVYCPVKINLNCVSTIKQKKSIKILKLSFVYFSLMFTDYPR